jgi:hypothetical protein
VGLPGPTPQQRTPNNAKSNFDVCPAPSTAQPCTARRIRRDDAGLRWCHHTTKHTQDQCTGGNNKQFSPMQCSVTGQAVHTSRVGSVPNTALSGLSGLTMSVNLPRHPAQPANASCNSHAIQVHNNNKPITDGLHTLRVGPVPSTALPSV